MWAEVGEVGEVQNLGHGGDPGVRRHSEELSNISSAPHPKEKTKGKNSTKLVKEKGDGKEKTKLDLSQIQKQPN